jgi:hypothetical protein
MKKLTILLLIMFFSASVYSQKLVCMPDSVARLLAQDLVSGDSARMVLPFLEQELSFTKRKLSLKDSVIYNDQILQANLKNQVANEKKKSDDYFKMYGTCVNQFTTLAKTNKKLKTKLKFQSYISIALIGSITTLFIFKK